MATYLNKNMIDGVEELPRLTEEEFEEIPVAERPRAWVKRNATETDRGITAEDVQYSSTQNTKQKIDEISEIEDISDKITLATGFSLKSWGFINAKKIGKMVKITIYGFISSSQFSTATPVANVSFNISGNDMGVATVGDEGEKSLACRTRSNDNTIVLNDPIPANTNMYLTIEGFTR